MPSYSGPHKVISKHDKYFVLLLNGKEDPVTIDRLKPAVEYPFNIVPLNLDFLLNSGVITEDPPIEEEATDCSDEILEDTRELRDCTEYNPININIPVRSRAGRLIRLPKHLDDYVA